MFIGKSYKEINMIEVISRHHCMSDASVTVDAKGASPLVLIANYKHQLLPK